MDFIKRTISYNQFEYVDVNLSAETINYLIDDYYSYFGFEIPRYDESTLNYVEIGNALLPYFTLNQFNTTSGITQDYTIVTTTEPHGLTTDDRALLYPLFGQSDIISATTILYLGGSYGDNPTTKFILQHPYYIPTNGIFLTNFDQILAFFKGFNLQPTQNTITKYFDLLDKYLNSVDVADVDDIGIGEYYDNTPRGVFNELGFKVITSGGTSGATINIPIYLNQTIENLGVYNNVYSAITDNKDIIINDIRTIDPNIDVRNENIFIVTGTTIFSPNTPNTFQFRIWDGVTGNTINDFFDTNTNITGITTNMSARVLKYFGDDIRYSYKLSETLFDVTHTINRNTVPGINDGWIEYRTLRPLRNSNISYLSFTSYGLSPENVNVDVNSSRVKQLAVIFDEFKEGMAETPKIINDLFIDKGVFSVFEKVEKFGDIRTLDDFESYENGVFNVSNDEPKVSKYIIKTNGK